MERQPACVVCVLMALHTAAYVLSLIRRERIKRLCRLNEQVHNAALLSASFGRGFLSRGDHSVGLECLFAVWELTPYNTNEQLPYHQCRLSRSCELYYIRYLHTLTALLQTSIQTAPNSHSASNTAVSHLALSSITFSLPLFTLLFSSPHLLALPTCHRDSPLKKSDVFFLTYSSLISREFTSAFLIFIYLFMCLFLRCCL